MAVSLIPAFLAQRLEEQIDINLLTTDPDGTLPLQVTDNDAIGMALADGDLINANRAVLAVLLGQVAVAYSASRDLSPCCGAGVACQRLSCSTYPDTACPHAGQSAEYNVDSSPTSQDVLHAHRRTSGS